MAGKPKTEKQIEEIKNTRFVPIRNMVHVVGRHYSSITRWPDLNICLKPRKVYIETEEGGIMYNHTEQLIDTAHPKAQEFINKGKPRVYYKYTAEEIKALNSYKSATPPKQKRLLSPENLDRISQLVDTSKTKGIEAAEGINPKSEYILIVVRELHKSIC